MNKPRRTRSIRTRMALTLVLFSLASCAVFGVCAWVTYELTLSHILSWHSEPVMRMLIRAREAGSPDEEIHALARSLRVSWYTDSEIPDDMRPVDEPQKLSRARGGLYIFVTTAPDGSCFALTGKVTDLDWVELAMAQAAGGCALISLLAALLVSARLSRRLVRPLVELADGIRDGSPMEDSPLLGRGDEVGELAGAFADRERELRAFLVREQLFTGDVSHELRTPLTVLQGATEILEIRLEGDESLLPVVRRMQRTIDIMTVNVRTMLLLARTPEQLEMKPFDMSALVRLADDRVHELLAGRQVTYTRKVPDSLMLTGSSELAALVLHNLLDNACRYTSEGCVEVELDEHGFSVTNTAPPIDPKLRERMFERGVRGADKNTAPGSGLGLSLVQRGCERLGWRVRHEPRPKGNRFVVSFDGPARASFES
ncbi:MAG: HAMP domain-containing sensor histidine kinase [Desulfovibrionaceae bacterium]|nr:HAMP domain-containing sensor histidine kinase [Desulfovibrionaceae bacterium]